MTQGKLHHSPLAERVGKLQNQLTECGQLKKQLKQDLDWYRSFDLNRAQNDLRRVGDSLTEFDGELADVGACLARVKRDSDLVAPRASFWRNWRNPFASDRTQAKAEIADLQQQERSLSKRKSQLANKKKKSKSQQKQLDRDIERYASLDEKRLASKLAACRHRCSKLKKEHEILLRRKKLVDRKLAPLLESSESLHREAERLRMRSEQAQSFDARLSSARSASERKQIHGECENTFGVGSPRRVISDAQGDLRRCERDIRKLDARITDMAQRWSRDITGIVIDGNNLCYESERFVGLSALKPLCQHLKGTYRVVVVFDSGIESMVHMSESDIRQSLPGVDVHVVAAGRKADGTALSLARDEKVYVLSNDRFADFPEERAVKANRVLRHDIVNGKVLVEDLNIHVNYRS